MSDPKKTEESVDLTALPKVIQKLRDALKKEADELKERSKKLREESRG